jgi:hypothetical protein
MASDNDDGGAEASGRKSFSDFSAFIGEIFPRVMLSINSSASFRQWLRWF